MRIRQTLNSVCLLQKEKGKSMKEKPESHSELRFERILERENFSLEIRTIRPSVVFGTRRRIALRGEGFAWVPDLGSFLKLLEVGVSP